MKKFVSIAVLALAVGGMTIAGCARQISPDVHTGRTAGDTIATYGGVIETARFVEIQEGDTLERKKTGQLLGGLAGGVAGARFGDGVGRALAIGAGAIVGAFVGAFAEREIKRQPAIEYIVRTERGDLVTIVQGTQPQLSPGQRVYVQEGRYGRGRVVPAA
ncbi:MAG: glycine zipper 2TM domain-containing protein [Pseudomonadota bacterium]